ncbi:hypothetical protein [Mesorhizobium sp. CAU 1732]|uniref:hypothetical protein n=1 Tax=Mesorhizobium sp. CAU 1732 TaxID=3140358 RepID=UPI0032605354
MPGRRNTLSATTIDKGWPHQVALPDDICIEENLTMIFQFLKDRGLDCRTRHVQAIWPDRRYQHMRLHCFPDRASVEAFQAVFGGEFFDPSRDREGGKVRGPWRRHGAWARLLESGPLKVPKILRD